MEYPSSQQSSRSSDMQHSSVPDTFSSNTFDFHSINPDHTIEIPSSGQEQIQTKANHRVDYFKLSASQLPNFFKGCDYQSSDPLPSSTFICNPNPARLPIYISYPQQSSKQSRFYCCKDFSMNPLHELFKVVIEYIYHAVLDEDFRISALHAENHQKLHRILVDMMDCLEAAGMLKMFERIAKTFADGRASDVLIDFGLSAERKSYSNAAGEFKLTDSFIRDVFSLKENDDMVEYSEFQPVSQYFLQQLHQYSAPQQAQWLILEVSNNSSVFVIRTNRHENRPYLPMLFSLGMIVGCPYAGYLSAKLWVFRKEMLYLCAKLFGMLNISMTRLLLNLMLEDIQIHSKRYKVFCRPLWRVLMSVERSYGELECLSHVPRAAVTVVEMSRFAEILVRHIPLRNFTTAEIEQEHLRVMWMYDHKHEDHLKVDWIKAILMYERRQLIEKMPQFVPRLKWIHARNLRREAIVETTLEENTVASTHQPNKFSDHEDKV